MGETYNKKRYAAIISPFSTSIFHYRKPFVVAWWAASFPGFGHFMLNKYLTAFILISWEVVINNAAHLNEAIYLSMIGKFEKAVEVLDQRWVIVYICIYVFSIWDSFRLTVEMNKHYTMAYQEGLPIIFRNTSTLEINLLDSKSPIFSLFWSLLTPGLGNLYASRIFSVIFFLTWWLIITYKANVYSAIHVTLMGDFQHATRLLVPQWFLFIPSIYCFAAYDSYVSTVETNKLMNQYMSRELKGKYQDLGFKMPL